MKNIWSSIATFLSGVIAGLLLFLKLKDPDQVTYDTQNIGKLKQFGAEGSTQVVDLKKNSGEGQLLSPKEERQKCRAERKDARIARREERRAAREREE
jgi:uncharacterized membrane protein